MIRKMLFTSTIAIVMVMVFMTSTAFASIDPVFGPPEGQIEIIVGLGDPKTTPGATSVYILLEWTEAGVAPINIVNIQSVVAPIN